tara:strand:+ start:2163 stop:2597 length:435 start_codon:yes stop_codon:yes gene_type:complete
MAITYENVIYDRIIDNLHSLIANEFSISISLDVDEERPNQSFLIIPSSDSLIELLADGQSREYTIDIDYQLTLSGNYTKNSYKQLSEIAERMKRLVHNNTSYSPSGNYKWHDGRIINTTFERSEDDPTISNVIMQFNCTSTEVF